MPLTTICFDADDTLWENEVLFHQAHARFAALLAPYSAQAPLMARLLDHERKNIAPYGFGVKGFVLSMIETAIEVSEGRVSPNIIKELMDIGKEMLDAHVTLLPHVDTIIQTLRAKYDIIIITKGDLLDQERKFQRSTLSDIINKIEVLSNKTPQSYQRLFARHKLVPQECLMVGNSMKSDILPVLETGGWAAFIEHKLTWVVEHAEAPTDNPRFFNLNTLSNLPDLVEHIQKNHILLSPHHTETT